MDLQACVCPSLENKPCVHLFVVPECHSAGYWDRVTEKGDFSLFCFKSHDKFHKVNKSRVVTATIRSCLHTGTMLLLLPLLLLSNLNSSYYLPGVKISFFFLFWSHIFFPYKQLDVSLGRMKH